jgi:glycerophosphoryl diester phosphodiesterase
MPTPATVSSLRADSDPARVLVAAHRGAWGSAPENSLAAVAQAIDLGADIVELDVRATADGALILHHDATVDRMCNGSGDVQSLSLRQIRHLHLRAGAGSGLGQPPLTSEPPATLGAALELARDRIIVNIDTKDRAQATRVAQFVVAAGMADQVFVKANIRSLQDLDAVRAGSFFGRVCFVPMMRACPGQFALMLKAMAALGCPMYEVEFDDIAHLEEGRAELARQGARLWVNTIAVSHSQDFNDQRALRDPSAVWGRLLAAGVGAIQTDEVPALIRFLTEEGRR